MAETLLHTCCAPCSVACVQQLRAEGIEPVSYWYNPNIHPLHEYKTRRNTLVEYARSIHMKLEIEDIYGLRSFIRDLCPNFDNRCGYCYRIRMEQAARFAAENGYFSFSTTLLISPYQKHELIRQAGEQAGEKYGVAFLYRDFRPVFQDGQRQAAELGLYRQKYCGCIFSEEDRYDYKKQKRERKKALAEQNNTDEPR